MAYAQAWHDRYASSGLHVVGVHHPELERTRSESALRVALAHWNIQFPILLDPERKVWNGLGNMSWDACHIFGRKGKFRAIHAQGAPVRQIELDLQEVLKLKQPPRLLDPLFPEDAPGATRLEPSPDMHLGFRLGEIGNLEGYLPQESVEYLPDGKVASGSKPILRGIWEAGPECLIARPRSGQRSAIELKCNAREVFVLAESEKPAQLEVKQGQKTDTVAVHELALVQLIGSERLENLRLKLSTADDGLKLYVLRFTTEAVKPRE